MTIINKEPELDFNDVLIAPEFTTVSSRSLPSLISKKLENILGIQTNGIIAANMDGVGTISMARELFKHKSMTALHKHYPVETLIEYFRNDESASHTFYSMGISTHDMNKFDLFLQGMNDSVSFKSIPFKICMDVANGYMQKFHEAISLVEKKCQDYGIRPFIMAGNVVCASGVSKLSQAGANAAKVGIGSGAVCTTRLKTGIGRPQLSAILECVQHCKPDTYNTEQLVMQYRKSRLPYPPLAKNDSRQILICSDGGCVHPKDLCIAFGAGADFVMIGTMLSGTEQSEGEKVIINDKPYYKFYGMSSHTAQIKHSGDLKDYRSSEGRTILVEPKGDVSKIITDIIGSLHSAYSYTNSLEPSDFIGKVSFRKVNNYINKSVESKTIGY